MLSRKQLEARDTIESALFSWESWEEIEAGVQDYSGVTLKVDVGRHPTNVTNQVCYKCDGEGFIAADMCPACERGRVAVAAPEFTAGKTFSHAVVDYSHSLITFYDTKDDEVGHSYSLSLHVGASLR